VSVHPRRPPDGPDPRRALAQSELAHNELATPSGTLGALTVPAFHDERELGGGRDLAQLGRMWPLLRPNWPSFAGALGLMPMTSAVALLGPYLLGRAVDAALLESSLAPLMQVVAFYALIVAGEFALRFGQTYLMQLAGQKTMLLLRRIIFAHIQRLSVGYFDRTPIGRVVTRVTNDVDSLSEFFSSGAVTAVADIVTLVGVVAFMLFIDWELALVTLATLPPLALVINAFRRYARHAFRDIRARVAQLNAYLAEQVSGIAVVQAFGREARCAAEYDRINDGHREANYRAIRFDALLYSVVESVSVLTVALVLWYASTEAELADPAIAATRIGTIVTFYAYIQLFFVPIRDLSTKYTVIQSALASAERIFGLLDEPAADAVQRDDAAPPAITPDMPMIRFEDVSFAYRAGQPVLRDVRVDVRAGETVAIVGATGSGKTTFTSLLLRLYEYDDGVIRLDGVDIRAIERHELRRRFAVVPQDVFLFGGTLLENVTFGSVVDEARARDALVQVGAWERVVERRGGLDAVVDERGANFSAGERQLIAFARALYRDPSILILDEATANIDSETEAQLQRAVLTLLEGRTSIVIAHRLSTIQHADRILVFHRGEIVEQGTHDELLAQAGVYARLHALQFEHGRSLDEGASDGNEV
jgi:ATP-binding cassette subfamily B protein